MLFALHRGSRFCQIPLFFTVGVDSCRADPAAVWVSKAVEVALLLGNSFGRAAFASILAARTEGPVAAAKATLAWAGLEIRGTTLWSQFAGEGKCVGLDEAQTAVLCP